MITKDQKIIRWQEKMNDLVFKYLTQNHRENQPVVNYLPPLELRDSVDVALGKSHSEDECWSLVEKVLDKSVRTTHPLFLNQLFGGYQPEAVTAEWLTTLLNPTMATYEVAPLMTIIENFQI
jgi:sulfinoalanine decarboxylase